LVGKEIAIGFDCLIPKFDRLPCGFRCLRLLNPFGESFENRRPATHTPRCASRHGESDSMSAENRRTAATLGTGIMAAIGRELRLMYNDILAEGVPERFAAILRRLDERSNEGSKNDPPPPAAP